MKYEKEVKELIKDLFFEQWMAESDWLEFEKELISTGKVNYEDLSKDLEIGESNGYDVDFQIEVCKNIIKESR